MGVVQKWVWAVVVMVLIAAFAGCTSDDVDSEPGDEDEDGRGSEGEGPTGPSVDISELNETVLTEGYTGHGVGAFAFNTGCEWDIWEPGGPENLGGACFEFEKGTKKVEFEVKDDLAPDVGVYIRYDTTGDPAGFYCNEGSFFPPEDASWAMVIIGDLGTCVMKGIMTASTTGEITFTMYHP